MNFRGLVLLPSYNSGPRLRQTAREAQAFTKDLWIVIDGSTDGSDAGLDADFRVLRLPENRGKGGAVEAAFRLALAEGFTHALVMDADGQHPASCIPEFLETAWKNPACLIAGVPVFGDDAPPERVKGRMVGNTLARIETLGRGARDSLFGFRVYPLAPSLRVLESTRSGRRFDFDTVLAVRLTWEGVPTINLPAPVKYPPRTEGGVTHFRYLRDNLLLARVHAGLFFGLLPRIPRLIAMP